MAKVLNAEAKLILSEINGVIRPAINMKKEYLESQFTEYVYIDLFTLCYLRVAYDLERFIWESL